MDNDSWAERQVNDALRKRSTNCHERMIFDASSSDKLSHGRIYEFSI